MNFGKAYNPPLTFELVEIPYPKSRPTAIGAPLKEYLPETATGINPKSSPFILP
jgi:hypothetical protein